MMAHTALAQLSPTPSVLSASKKASIVADSAFGCGASRRPSCRTAAAVPMADALRHHGVPHLLAQPLRLCLADITVRTPETAVSKDSTNRAETLSENWVAPWEGGTWSPLFFVSVGIFALTTWLINRERLEQQQ